ncbi:MAG TPA: hypothetical protein VHU90_03875 [Galbitalea sp.]|nr:hypothetical protein [Galbitalea sp.]
MTEKFESAECVRAASSLEQHLRPRLGNGHAAASRGTAISGCPSGAPEAEKMYAMLIGLRLEGAQVDDETRCFVARARSRADPIRPERALRPDTLLGESREEFLDEPNLVIGEARSASTEHECPDRLPAHVEEGQQGGPNVLQADDEPLVDVLVASSCTCTRRRLEVPSAQTDALIAGNYSPFMAALTSKHGFSTFPMR